MWRSIEWMKKMGLASRLVWVSFILTAALLRVSAAYGADEDGRNTAGGQAAAASAVKMSDIGTHWAKASIEAAVSKGYVNGYPDGTFKPNKAVTRAEFVKMVSDSLHLPVETTAPGAKWYTPYVAALKGASLLADSDLSADWNGNMNRTEMAKLLTRGSDDSVRGKKLTDGEALYKAVSAGLIGGLPDGTLNENGTMTRAEAVTVIERLATVRSGGKLDADPYALQYAAILYKGTNIEEAWGVKSVALPYKMDFGTHVEVYMDKMILIDIDDPKSPMRNRVSFLYSLFDGSTTKENAYVVALHFSAKNDMTQKGMWSFNGNMVVSFADLTGYHWTSTRGLTDFPLLQGFELSKTPKADGWYTLFIKKDYIKQKPTAKRVVLFNSSKQDFVYFTELQEG